MQLFALDSSGRIISSISATKGTLYQCPECGSSLRLKSGPRRKPHFYHISDKRSCRQSGKTLAHLQAQLRVQSFFPEGQCQLEKPFPFIGRIADCAWTVKTTVFEVQYSPISREEIIARNQDYKNAGWNVIWIFSEKRFRKRWITEAELALGNAPYCYTDINDQGVGLIYQASDTIQGGKRIKRSIKIPVDLQRPLVNQTNAPFYPASKKSFSPTKLYGAILDRILERACH